MGMDVYLTWDAPYAVVDHTSYTMVKIMDCLLMAIMSASTKRFPSI